MKDTEKLALTDSDWRVIAQLGAFVRVMAGKETDEPLTKEEIDLAAKRTVQGLIATGAWSPGPIRTHTEWP